MADQHIGFPGTVNSAQLSLWVPNVGIGQYHVEGLEDGRVVTNAIGDRGVYVKPGKIIGDGIMDIFEANTQLNFASVAAGSPDRWDMVVLRRLWNATPGSSTATYTIIQGGPNRALPARNNNKGVLADQPIALCRIKAGSTAVQEIVDLRCWAHNGGMIALDKLVMSYQDQIGTTINIAGETWTYQVNVSNGTYSAAWKMINKLDYVQLGNIRPGLSSPTIPDDQPFTIQAGSVVQQADGSGYARITWGAPFPNGLLTCILQNGDSSASSGAMMPIEGNEPFWGPPGIGDKNSVVYTVLTFNSGTGTYRPTPWQWHRVNYIAIGW